METYFPRKILHNYAKSIHCRGPWLWFFFLDRYIFPCFWKVASASTFNGAFCFLFCCVSKWMTITTGFEWVDPTVPLHTKHVSQPVYCSRISLFSCAFYWLAVGWSLPFWLTTGRQLEGWFLGVKLRFWWFFWLKMLSKFLLVTSQFRFKKSVQVATLSSFSPPFVAYYAPYFFV